ncbi:MAG: hypothetical protein AAGF92_08055 [Myxococcota bacterium]
MSASSWQSARGPTSAFLLAICVVGCSRQTEESPPQPLVPLPPGPAAEPEDPYLRSKSRFGVVHLHAGFNPDPRVIDGTAEGQVKADAVHRRCKGWTSETPDYLVSADTAFLQLYVLGRSENALALMLRKPDGSVVCRHSRSASRSPVLRTDLPLGTSQLWVGVLEEGESAPYRLGFSEVTWRASSVPLPEAPSEPAATAANE